MLWFKPSFIETNLKRNNKNRKNNEKDVIPIVSNVGSVTAARIGTAVGSRAVDGKKS
jgi:hypothetical protein